MHALDCLRATVADAARNASADRTLGPVKKAEKK